MSEMQNQRGFHTSQGLYFERLDDGSVRVTKYAPGEPCSAVECLDGDACWHDAKRVFQQTIESSVWESVMANMGLATNAYEIAKQLHSGSE